MNFESSHIIQKSSFAVFVYPFIFETGKFDERVQITDNAEYQDLRHKQTEQKPLVQITDNAVYQKTENHVKFWEAQAFSEDDILSAVADYLNIKDNSRTTARLWKLSDSLRDTFGFRADWNLNTSSGKIPFGFGRDGSSSIQLALFRVGVGFLTVQAQPKRENTDRMA